MACYIYTEDHKEYSWRFGTTELQLEELGLLPGKYVTCVRADGVELRYILSKFKNIPVVDEKKMIWRGDFAKFIVDNL